MPLVFAWAFIGLAAAFQELAPTLYAGAAQEQPVLLAQTVSSQSQVRDPAARNIDDWFRDFTAEWVRNDPSLATRARYFAGEEQDRLERQLTPRTGAWKRARIQVARRGLVELQTFERALMNENQRLSADVMQWQLQSILDEEPFLDDIFPLEQFQGANVSLVNAIVVVHPLRTERDAENYVAALGQVATRMEEATAEAQRLASNGVFPPNFILRSTIEQMQRFVAVAPAQNPFVAIFSQKMGTIQALSDTKRDELPAQAEEMVRAEIYPAWQRAIALLESQLPRATDDAGLWRLKDGAAALCVFSPPLHDNQHNA
jgi:uncharacterized protein (DUF885 family)